MSHLEVVEPGPLATVQDLGRPGLGHLGVPVGGAADRWSHRAANALLGNDPGAATLEITAGGTVLRALSSIVVAIAGADLDARVEGVPAPPGRSVQMPVGRTLAFGAARSGMRAYVAVPGGLDAPLVLGSRATLAAAGLGGPHGRPLAPGDRLASLGPSTAELAGRRWPEHLAAPPWRRGGALGLVAGPDSERLPDALAGLLAGTWRVRAASDRVGLRMDGPPITGGEGAAASFGVVPGAVQLPPDGVPIILLADHQTVGGYRVIGVVASVDLPRLAQARPGDRLAFEALELAEAHRRLRAQAEAFEIACAALRASVRWDAQHLDAGG